jgi:DNA-binding FadR family transcriptional regulator
MAAGHRAVVDAIEARDGARARALTEDHIETRTRWSIELRLGLGKAAEVSSSRREVS